MREWKPGDRVRPYHLEEADALEAVVTAARAYVDRVCPGDPASGKDFDAMCAAIDRLIVIRATP